MQRTNLYLAEAQCAALDELAHAGGTSRAALIRRLLDEALANDVDDLVDDLAAIRESFGALAGEDARYERGLDERGLDERTRHLQRVARR